MIKTASAKIKAAGTTDGLSDGQFVALVSCFGNVDSYGDVVMPGAFTKTLDAWAASGNPIPVYWSHRMDDPDMNIGEVLHAEETDQGLQVKAQLDMESPKAQQVYRLLKGRRVTQFSFSYDIVDAGMVTKDGEDYYELRDLKLHELGPTPIGANDATELLAVKSAQRAAARFADDVKAGRTISAANESMLSDAHDAAMACAASIKNVLASIDSGKAKEPEKASGTGPVKEASPDAGAPVDPSPNPSVDDWDSESELFVLEGQQQ